MLNWHERFPTVPLAFLPTPLHRLPRLSEHLGGPDLWIKRDDLTGLAFGGNKVRKLEFLLAEALQQGADTVLTVGAGQSNHARATAVAARKLGLDAHLVLGGHRPARLTANLLLSDLAGAHLHFAGTDSWPALEARMAELADELRGQGRRPYTAPIGGSTPLGILGFVAAFEELQAQCQPIGLEPTHLVCASSSGGTQAGIEVGRRIRQAAIGLVGMGVAKTEGELATDVLRLVQETLELLGQPLFCAPGRLTVEMGYLGPGYAVRTPEADEAIRLLARLEGIFLDPVYTGKAMAGLIDWIRRGHLGPEHRVVFWHTGGNVALFADQE